MRFGNLDFGFPCPFYIDKKKKLQPPKDPNKDWNVWKKIEYFLNISAFFRTFRSRTDRPARPRRPPGPTPAAAASCNVERGSHGR